MPSVTIELTAELAGRMCSFVHTAMIDGGGLIGEPQGMDLAGDEVDAGQQADCAMALIFMLTCEGRMYAGLGRQVRSGGCDGLDTRLLVVKR
jgi:hypothetical protein